MNKYLVCFEDQGIISNEIVMWDSITENNIKDFERGIYYDDTYKTIIAITKIDE